MGDVDVLIDVLSMNVSVSMISYSHMVTNSKALGQFRSERSKLYESLLEEANNNIIIDKQKYKYNNPSVARQIVLDSLRESSIYLRAISSATMAHNFPFSLSSNPCKSFVLRSTAAVTRQRRGVTFLLLRSLRLSHPKQYQR